MEYLEEGEPQAIAAMRLSWAPPLAIGLMTLAGITNAVTSGLNELALCVLAHANWKEERRSFREEAALSIETIVGGSE